MEIYGLYQKYISSLRTSHFFMILFELNSVETALTPILIVHFLLRNAICSLKDSYAFGPKAYDHQTAYIHIELRKTTQPQA